MAIRIIAGVARGRLLEVPRRMTLRPASSRLKVALFSHLAERIPEAKVLDLFAGTGAYGIEALSRGAREATFVDTQPEAVRCIQRNLQSLGFAAQARVVRASAQIFLQKDGNRYDLIFAGPPYQKKHLRVDEIPLLSAVAQRLSPQGLFIWEFCRWNEVVLPSLWQISWEKAFGETRVWVLRLTGAPEKRLSEPPGT
ncbi:16S rRNA (guanine(966)-N(2))-methyltransferase RsmD [Candidatus Methylacidithermus pantelleriae]|uniref:16S rRNA (Guanine(966)-N(2))-methyltransferase RsmD n=1 Tax=Candidatus Methylacidithermus pantelleriae TaxID=2744239 RepID=A0A8J2FQH4_9BACT|nr:16S rRNA (guanine(966)-N(2))-methyltransferase RsmD [Candidatus Methylacidithermus pantelleriae]CAF0698813.1 16S rRNA (Guanine(966)-N(2))-methyltransferase RsmD [Candidatus Methylacidithermus pantelleriae]